MFKPLFEDENQWHVVDLKEKKGTTEEELDEENKLILKNNTITVGRSIEVGNIGAHAWEEGKEKDYYLVEFLEEPKTVQDEETGAAWKVECQFLNDVPSAPLWFTKSVQKVSVDVCKVVATDLKLQPISPTNVIKSKSKRL